MMKRKSKLNYQPVFSFLLIGISSHENDYHLSWAINTNLGFQLTRNIDLVVPGQQKGEFMSFSIFSYDDQQSLIGYNLISNTGDNGFLIPEYKNIDFFLQINGKLKETSLNRILDKLRMINIISTCFIITPESIKSPEKLLIN